MKYTKAERIMMRSHPEMSEKWIQQLIAEDPSILGLGDLVLRAQERIHPKAGRLDLLLQDPDTNRRYEVELQLGPTDESHIIRTIEYWDIERKRYPQYDHCAVIVAEDITSRFLNVISLFNGTIPLIAIQVQAVKVGSDLTLVFTKVMDELVRGLVDEDEDAAATPTDRSYWIKTGSQDTVKMVDEMMEIIKEVAGPYQPKYNKIYIGLALDGIVNNFATFRPKKAHLVFEVKLPRVQETDQIIEQAGIETLDYDNRWKSYRLRLAKGDVGQKKDTIRMLVKMAFDYRSR
ncbi:hypothetical protein ASG25_21160 [Rhizobium sp. Leaf384]|uniref:hypothetical protein n=1 Tax=unclassified Rhizobium TaxID=2613769 RepID=UPI00071623ED|nr:MULTISPECIES: hypothetical protein [unclassified Rhizobium]KQS74308.1 hypothetical protein ASG25_21160 [Rhizobium sp. Leaf384]KQS83951.1 hypothetical protein ASG58_21540 [Rhizobium sp. Leaf383]